MGIKKVSELTEVTGLTDYSLFLISEKNGLSYESNSINTDNLRKAIDRSVSFVTDGNTGIANVENIRIIHGPAIDTSFAPHTATFDFSGYINDQTPRLGASFYSTQTQTTTGTTQAMTFTDQDVTLGVGLTGDTNSEILIIQAGFYNIQFSAQIQKTQGGTSEDIYIWFRVNGQDVPNSNTKLTLANNGQFIVASWNIFLMLQYHDKVEIMWGTSDNHIELVAVSDAQTPFGPAIPSVIATITQI
jgi:hypothetical protein